MRNPLVSVIIPTYKRPDTLKRCIYSVLHQSYQNIEIIVVDDNDPDTEFRKMTEEIMTEFCSNTNIKYIKHPFNRNGSAARNTGISSSKGEYIMFLDDDDEFLEDKIRSQVECLEQKDFVWGACYTGYVRMNANGKVIAKCAEFREGSLLVEELKRNLFVHAGSNLMIRRKIVEELNGFDESFLRNQDVEFLVRLLKKYNLACVQTVGLVVHTHNSKNKVDFIDLTEQYVSKFHDDIDELPTNDKKSVYDMLELQKFRYYLISKKNVIAAFQIIHKNKLSTIKVLKYIFYLFNRAITKKVYGFNG